MTGTETISVCGDLQDIGRSRRAGCLGSVTLITEDDLIARYFAPIAGPGGLGLLDDAALIAGVPGCEQVVTADALVAGVHFFADDPPRSIARKCLGVNLSDLAAKGAKPQGFILTMALPSGWTEDWLSAFATGLGGEATAHACPLLGGDTVRTPGPFSVSITAFGTVPEGRMVPRTGAGAGDILYVTGTIGDAALGLRLRLDASRLGAAMSASARDHLLDRYLHPQPRLGLRDALLAQASGGMDISDGLVGDLRKMMRASGRGADIRLDAIPLSPAAREAIAADQDLFEAAVTGGDDYEILCSVPPDRTTSFERMANEAGVAVSAIGTVSAQEGRTVFAEDSGLARAFARGSFSHF